MANQTYDFLMTERQIHAGQGEGWLAIAQKGAFGTKKTPVVGVCVDAGGLLFSGPVGRGGMRLNCEKGNAKGNPH